MAEVELWRRSTSDACEQWCAGNDQGVDGEEHRDVAVQLQHSSLQIHHHSPQWREVEVHVTVHSEELSRDRGAGRARCGELHEHGEGAG